MIDWLQSNYWWLSLASMVVIVICISVVHNLVRDLADVLEMQHLNITEKLDLIEQELKEKGD